MPRKKFPEGLKIQDKKGPGKLSETLEKLKKYSFQGYIRITVDEELEGYVTLKDGSPKNALLYTPSDMEISGDEAFSKIIGMDGMENIYLEVHTNIDIDNLIEDIGGKVSEDIQNSIPENTDEAKELFERVEEDTKKIQEEVSEESEDELISTESKEITEEIHRKDREEKELEVYDMVIKGKKGKKVDNAMFPEKFSFKTFVVGENNKLAYVASKELARSSGRSFNPLVLTSDAGLGKTHLLKSIGHYVTKNRPEFKVVYSTTENCTSEIITSLREEGSEELREKYYKADILLLDDIQFLASREKHQEIIFYLFNHLNSKGSQIILTCDRPPEEIPDLKGRLVSRFKSGLVVRIEIPSYETRLKIIDEKLKHHEMNVPEEVKEFLATHVTKNVREIEGAINRLLAFSSLLNEEITLESVKNSFQGKIGDKKEKQVEGVSEELQPGVSYMIEEERPDKGFKILEDILKKGNKIYIISRINPNRLSNEYYLDGAEMFWLSGRESEELKTVRPNLESITYRLEEIIEEGKVILLDGVEYLISHTGFDATIQFLRHMIDTVSETDTIFLITVSPSALKERQISILEREMEVLSDSIE
ncbi:MAG: DnaA ATPase domain-containing protein [Candidatus Saliniplasma sp.]